MGIAGPHLDMTHWPAGLLSRRPFWVDGRELPSVRQRPRDWTVGEESLLPLKGRGLERKISGISLRVGQRRFGDQPSPRLGTERGSVLFARRVRHRRPFETRISHLNLGHSEPDRIGDQLFVCIIVVVNTTVEDSIPLRPCIVDDSFACIDSHVDQILERVDSDRLLRRGSRKLSL